MRFFLRGQSIQGSSLNSSFVVAELPDEEDLLHLFARGAFGGAVSMYFSLPLRTWGDVFDVFLVEAEHPWNNFYAFFAVAELTGEQV